MRKILVIEPSPLLAIGIQSVFNAESDMKVIDILRDATHLKEHLVARHPDIILLNPSVIDYKHQENIRHALEIAPSIPLIAFVHSLYGKSLLQQFDDVVSIHDSLASITNVIRQVRLNSDEGVAESENEPLTDREKEILIAVAKGLTNKEIADKHFISIHTVISHRKNIVKKTGIKTVSGLTVFALINKLISADEI